MLFCFQGLMPKVGLDVTRNEIMRFYKLSASGSVCEPISMIGLYSDEFVLSIEESGVVHYLDDDL